MTNDSARIEGILRSFIVYAICAILAIIIGVLMTNPMTYSSLGFVAVLCAVMFVPIVLKWHYPLTLLSWNAPIMMFFIKGDPRLFLVMITLSIAISITERALNQPRFINIPTITWSLFCLIGVVMVTALFTGGIGLKAFGSDVYGGKKYIFLAVAVLGYFALAAQAIPPERAQRYVAFFFLGGVVSVISDFYPITPGFLHPIFWLVPPSMYADTGNGPEGGIMRLAGTAGAGVAVYSAMIARYGLRGIFLSDKLWRPVVFFLMVVLVFFGGFRSGLILMGGTILLQFFLEGLHRTKLMPFFTIFALAFAALIFCLGPALPVSFQRALAFVPENVMHLRPEARLDAQASWQWRIDMWEGLLPQIPSHLLLGKGYAISMEDYASMGQDSALRSADPGQQALALSGDYHNGPLSVILPFGIWGVFAFGWFLLASIFVMYRNYRYSDPGLKTINTFLFVSYVMLCISFYGGNLAVGMGAFTGLLGLSVAINRGVRRAPVTASTNIPFNIPFAKKRLRPTPAFQKRST